MKNLEAQHEMYENGWKNRERPKNGWMDENTRRMQEKASQASPKASTEQQGTKKQEETKDTRNEGNVEEHRKYPIGDGTQVVVQGPKASAPGKELGERLKEWFSVN